MYNERNRLRPNVVAIVRGADLFGTSWDSKELDSQFWEKFGVDFRGNK